VGPVPVAPAASGQFGRNPVHHLIPVNVSEQPGSYATFALQTYILLFSTKSVYDYRAFKETGEYKSNAVSVIGEYHKIKIGEERRRGALMTDQISLVNK